MPAYYANTLSDFLDDDPRRVLGELQHGYAKDRFVSQLTSQSHAWEDSIELLRDQLEPLCKSDPNCLEWGLLLEYPLYRLRQRIDAVIIAGSLIFVVEFKTGDSEFTTSALWQTEEYALDLRDFHLESHNRRIRPVLCVSGSGPSVANSGAHDDDLVAPLTILHPDSLGDYLLAVTPRTELHNQTDHFAFNSSVYHPVPNVIEAATAIFSGYEGDTIVQHDADNLKKTTRRVVELVEATKRNREFAVIVITGVPGSGKTLLGLNVTHDVSLTGNNGRGDIVYLSGNTPLITVLRAALVEDEHARQELQELQPPDATSPAPRRTKDQIRRDVRSRIQHINDYLKEGYTHAPKSVPHEHAIVFDEAQRAWDAKQGELKFERPESEPRMLLALMGRHSNWAACVCLIGSGQEINKGEKGLVGWNEAIELERVTGRPWRIYAPSNAVTQAAFGPTASRSSDSGVEPLTIFDDLELSVPMRTYRTPLITEWVDAVLAGDTETAKTTAKDITDYPIVLTRSLEAARNWLSTSARGFRRCGLVTSSGAVRMRGEGLGVFLTPNDGAKIAHWYLQPRGDIRSSYALEVPANEFACQGLELDFVGVCWGGDLVWNREHEEWTTRRLAGPKWNTARTEERQTYTRNAYRVLLTRAREGLILFIPHGVDDDDTRDAVTRDETAEQLIRCGATMIA